MSASDLIVLKQKQVLNKVIWVHLIKKRLILEAECLESMELLDHPGTDDLLRFISLKLSKWQGCGESLR